MSLHRDLQTSAGVTCLCWVAAYLLGSVPIGHLLERGRLRRDLRRLEGGRLRRRAPEDLRVLLGGSSIDPSAALPTLTEVAGAILDTAKVVGLAVAALVLVKAWSPGVHRGLVPAASGFGTYSSDVLTFWQSASLWAGLVAGVGHTWPVWLGFRSGGQGQAPLLALAMRFTPIAFVIAVGGYLAARPLAGGRGAVAISLGGFVAWTWAAWLWSLPHWWGLLPGPEVAVWAGVLTGVVAARNLASPRP
jgi:glycerol-3-phosphate acyltransferase PlsY